MYANAIMSYQQTNVVTADPARLVLMCLDGAIRGLKQAKESYLLRDYEAKGLALQKTLDILHELNASLDMDKGGEIAGKLRALYLYMTQRLIAADLKKDLAVFDDVRQLLENLESAWQEIASGHPQRAVFPPLKMSLNRPMPPGAAVHRPWSV